MKNIHYKRTLDCQQKLKDEKLDAFLTTDPKDSFYLTGFHQNEGFYILVTQKEVYAFVVKMLYDHFKQTCNWAEVIIYEDFYTALSSKIKELRIKKYAFDATSTVYFQATKLMDIGFSTVNSFLKEFKMIKENEEFENLKKACEIAAKTFEIIKPRIKTGMREIDVAREIEYIMQKLGASTRSFETIVGFGSNSALPHHHTSQRRLKKNEVVLLDFGCIYNRYCSDITRTFFYGNPDEEFKKIYAIVEKAQKQAVKYAKDGVKAKDVDKIARDIISENGYGQYFIHGTGHGVGLLIHEPPTLNPRSEDILKHGMSVTVEPGIYLYGKFGIRIEDTIYITKKNSKILTKI